MKFRQTIFYVVLMFAAPAFASDELMEETSRKFMKFNMQTIKSFEPQVMEYREHHSEAVHWAIENFLQNLHEPLTVVNSVLGLDIVNGLSSTGRFLINTTVGLGGFFDPAEAIGLKRDRRSFGETLGYWGVPAGDYFVLPLVGPTTVRDFSAGMASLVFDPMNFVAPLLGTVATASEAGFGIYDGYDFVMATNETSVDSYATFKTMYLQNREKKINEHRIFGNIGNDYDFDMEME